MKHISFVAGLFLVLANNLGVAATKNKKTAQNKPQKAKATQIKAPIVEFAFTDPDEKLGQPKVKRPKYVKIQIRTPDRKRLKYKWTQYPSHPFVWGGSSMQGTVLKPEKWFTKPGTYTFTIRTPKSKSKTRIKITGKELKTRIMFFWHGQKARILSKYRYWPPTLGVTLDKFNFDNKTSHLAVTLVNNSKKTLYSGYETGGAEGYVEYKSKQGWLPNYHGGICGMVGIVAIQPKGSISMGEHFYFNTPKYPPGRYRFVAQYALKDNRLGTPIKKIRDIHMVVKEFTLPFKPTGKPNSTTTR